MRLLSSESLRRVVPCILVLAAAAPSLRAQTPSTWHEVARGDDGTRVTIDSSTVSHTRDSTFVVRTAIHFPEPMQVSGGRRVDHEVRALSQVLQDHMNQGVEEAERQERAARWAVLGPASPPVPTATWSPPPNRAGPTSTRSTAVVS